MKRFILLTFGFLGWAFYEMSGGAEFQPKSVTMAAMTPVVTQELPAPEPVAEVVQTAQAEPAVSRETTTSEDNVTRVSLNLTDVSDVNEAVQLALNSEEPVDDTSVLEISSTPNEEGNTPAIIPSLIVPDDAGAVTEAVVQEATLSQDIRAVAGNRVNVRGGPGTNYGIVSRLTRGAEVEILSDNGDGWVRMRPVEGGPVGWMADFLLTSG